MAIIYTEERDIAASTDTVFGVLTDFAQYPQWNPWIVRVEGQATVGSELLATVKSINSQRKVRHRVLAVERPQRFAWCDVGWFTVFTRGERVRQLQPLPGECCHYRCELRLTGPLAGLVDVLFGRAMRDGLAAEADALAGRAAALLTGHKPLP